MKNESFLSLLFWAFFVLAIGSACQTESDIEVAPPISTSVAINLEAILPSPLPTSTHTYQPTITPLPPSSSVAINLELDSCEFCWIENLK